MHRKKKDALVYVRAALLVLYMMIILIGTVFLVENKPPVSGLMSGKTAVALAIGGIMSVYVLLSAAGFLPQIRQAVFLGVVFTLSCGALLAVDKPQSMIFWAFGGLAVSMLIDRIMGLLMSYLIIYVSNVLPEENYIKLLIIHLVVVSVLCMFIKYMKHALNMIYGMVLVLTSIVSMYLIFNGFRIESVMSSDMLYVSLIYCLDILVCFIMEKLLGKYIAPGVATEKDHFNIEIHVPDNFEDRLRPEESENKFTYNNYVNNEMINSNNELESSNNELESSLEKCLIELGESEEEDIIRFANTHETVKDSEEKEFSTCFVPESRKQVYEEEEGLPELEEGEQEMFDALLNNNNTECIVEVESTAEEPANEEPVQEESAQEEPAQEEASKKELLEKLKTENEKVYNSSLKVAEISSKAAELLGYDKELCFEGALFAKIGKIKPGNYIKNGLEIGKEFNLPDRLLAFIEEHNVKNKYPESPETMLVMLTDTIYTTYDFLINEEQKDVALDKIVDNTFKLRVNEQTVRQCGIKEDEFEKLRTFFLNTDY